MTCHFKLEWANSFKALHNVLQMSDITFKLIDTSYWNTLDLIGCEEIKAVKTVVIDLLIFYDFPFIHKKIQTTLQSWRRPSTTGYCLLFPPLSPAL